MEIIKDVEIYIICFQNEKFIHYKLSDSILNLKVIAARELYTIHSHSCGGKKKLPEYKKEDSASLR